MPLAGLLLIGGQNKRMKGEKKYLLTYKEQTFIQLGVNLLSLFAPVYVSVSSDNQNNLINLPTIQDIYNNIGPMGGICSSLQKLNRPLLVLPCDMPCMNYQTLALLVNSYNCKKISSFLSVEGTITGLPGIYTKDFIPVLKKLIDKKNYRMKDAICQVPSQTINVKNSAVFSNINSPKEYIDLQTNKINT